MTWPQSGAAGIHYQCMVVIMSCTSSALLQCEANQVVTSPVTSSQLAAALESLKSQLFSLSSGTRNYAHGYYSFHHSSVGHILKKLRTPKILRKMALSPHLLVYSPVPSQKWHCYISLFQANSFENPLQNGSHKEADV